MLWLAKHGFRSSSSVSRLSKALILILTVKMLYVKAFTLQLILGSPYAHSKVVQRIAFSILNAVNRWSYGANRVQVDADVKVLSEFLSYLQTDTVRGSPAISSLSPVQSASRSSRTYRTLSRILVAT
jgi:phosphatidylinositol 4-kinase